MGYFDNLRNSIMTMFEGAKSTVGRQVNSGIDRLIPPSNVNIKFNQEGQGQAASPPITSNVISPLPNLTATPQPTSTPMPTPTLIPWAPQNPYASLLERYFSPEEVNNASNVMFKESSFNPLTTNQNPVGTDWGLFQINDYYQRKNLAQFGLTPEDLLDPETAIKFASWLQSQQGWNPWVGAESLGLRR